MRIVENGDPRAPSLLLVGNAAVSTTCWDPIVPILAKAFHVIRVDLLSRRRSAKQGGDRDIATLAGRVAAVVDGLGMRRVTVVGHSSGCTLATALAEQRPETVVGLALMSMGPNLDAKVPERPLVRLSLTRFPGRLLWRLRTEATVRKSARTAFTRPVTIPDAFVAHVLRLSHRDFVESMRAPLNYLAQQSLPARLAALGVPLLVIFGAEDRRWRPASAAEYRAVPGARVEILPGVGHTPMMEEPRRTAELLLDFAAAQQGDNVL